MGAVQRKNNHELLILSFKEKKSYGNILFSIFFLKVE